MIYIPLNEQTVETPELLLTVGISGCGKTTYVMNNYGDYENLNLDDIRGSLESVNDQTLTPQAVRIMNHMLTHAISYRKNIVISNTNLNIRYINQYIERAEGYKVTILCFDDSYDPQLCISRVRNAIALGEDRSNTPPHVINRMAEQYVELMKVLDGIRQTEMLKVIHV